MIEMNFQIKEALTKMNFINRYEELSKNYSAEKTPNNERLIYINGEEVIDTIEELGYIPHFNDKDKFFYIEEEIIGKYTFGFHIILQDGMVDLVWIVKKDNELLLGAPWSTYSRRIVDVNYRIKKPVFATYEDLDNIFKISFQMYEDFKKEMKSNM